MDAHWNFSTFFLFPTNKAFLKFRKQNVRIMVDFTVFAMINPCKNLKFSSTFAELVKVLRINLELIHLLALFHIGRNQNIIHQISNNYFYLS